MAYIRMDEARAVGRAAVPFQKSARGILSEQARAFDAALSYDIFLSHSFNDADAIYGVKRMIEALNLRVYVDWIDDPTLDRGKVTVKTAAVLRAHESVFLACLRPHPEFVELRVDALGAGLFRRHQAATGLGTSAGNQ